MISGIESQPLLLLRWKAAPSPWGNAARDLLAKSGSSSMSGFGSASALALRPESPEFYSLMHDRNGFELENSEAGASRCQCKRR